MNLIETKTFSVDCNNSASGYSPFSDNTDISLPNKKIIGIYISASSQNKEASVIMISSTHARAFAKSVGQTVAFTVTYLSV